MPPAKEKPFKLDLSFEEALSPAAGDPMIEENDDGTLAIAEGS